MRSRSSGPFVPASFERDVDAIRQVGSKPLSESSLIRIGADRSLLALADDLAELNSGATLTR